MIHKDLTSERWFSFSFFEQLSNVGTDIERTIRWKAKGDLDNSNKAFERALELLTLTICDPKNKSKLKEIVRAREALIDYFVYDNNYSSTDESWQRYFMYFSYIAASQRGK